MDSNRIVRDDKLLDILQQLNNESDNEEELQDFSSDSESYIPSSHSETSTDEFSLDDETLGAISNTESNQQTNDRESTNPPRTSAPISASPSQST